MSGSVEDGSVEVEAKDKQTGEPFYPNNNLERNQFKLILLEILVYLKGDLIVNSNA